MVSKRQTKSYDPALIERAIALSEEIGPLRAGKVLGVSGNMISTWLRRKRDGRYVSKVDTPEQKELIDTRRELQKVQRENEDLKKANILLRELASVFSKDHPHSNSEWSLNSSLKKSRNSV